MRNAATLSRTEMNQALTAGARQSGYLHRMASVHLLTFTDLPGRAAFARHVDLAEGEGGELVAYVRDWAALLADNQIRLPSSGYQLLALAAGYVQGHPVDLFLNLGGLGVAHAKRVIESVIIGCGMEGFYTLHDGPKMAELRATRETYAPKTERPPHRGGDPEIVGNAEGNQRDLERGQGGGPALDSFAQDTARRCQWALNHNDGHPKGVWSTGEQLAVALVLHDLNHLVNMDYTVPEARRRVLGGMPDPPKDLDAWLRAIRAEIGQLDPRGE